MQPMKRFSEVTPDEADEWWDELDKRGANAEELIRARLQAQHLLTRTDLFWSGDSAKAVLYFETKVERLAALRQQFDRRAAEVVNGCLFAAQMPFELDALIVLDSVEEMTERGHTFGTPFGWP